MNEVNKVEVGLRIKAIRQERGMNQSDFGKLLSATKGNVSLWESGNVIPNAERLKYIADLGSVTVNELLNGVKDESVSGVGNDRKKAALEYLVKARTLIELELLIDSTYYQVDLKTMGRAARNDLAEAIKNMEDAIRNIQ